MLNDTGKSLWDLLETWVTLEQLTRFVTEKYSIDYERASQDVKQFLKTLKERQLLEEKEGGKDG
jgi:hypothetical protein